MEFIVLKLDASVVYPGVNPPPKCAGANDLFLLLESICDIQKEIIKAAAVLNEGGYNDINSLIMQFVATTVTIAEREEYSATVAF